MTEFHVHLSAKHPVKATKGKLEYLSSKNSEYSEKGVVKKAGCDRCDFSSTDQFSLLLHKSTKHPTYILNSQPEAVTGPLH